MITAFVAPLAMAVVFGLMLGGTQSAAFFVGVVDGGSTPQSAGVVAAVLAGSDDTVGETDGGGETGADDGSDSGGVRFSQYDSVAEVETAVEDDVVGAAIIVGDDIDLTVITNPSSPLTGQIAQSVASGIASSLETGGAPAVELEQIAVGGRDISASAFFGASMAILLLFFSTGLAAQSILEDKENRTLDRMLAGPTTLWAILVGKVVAVAAMAVAGFITVWAVTSLVFGAEWGSPPAVLVLIVFTIFALAGVAMFVGGLASTAQQAITLTAVVTFGLSLLGGNFTGPADTPPTLRAVRGFTPNGRALEAFTALSADASSLGSIASTLAVLFLFGLVFGGVGLFSVRRRLAT